MTDEQMIQAMQTMLAPIQKSIGSIEGRLDSMEGKIGSLQEQFDLMQEDLTDVKERVTKIEIAQENVTNRNIKLLCESHQDTAAKLNRFNRMEMTLNDVKSDTEVIKDVVTQHSQSIRELKLAK